MAKTQGSGGSSKGARPKEGDAQRMQSELIEELRRDAARAGVEWRDLVRHADLSRSASSRLNYGEAGLEVISRLRRALNELAVAADEGQSAPVAPARAAPRRWVIAQRKDGKLFVGICDAGDDEIAEKGRVRLDRCRPILDENASAFALASVGPARAGVVGADESPSVLVLDVAMIYDCTRVAMRAFDQRK